MVLVPNKNIWQNKHELKQQVDCLNTRKPDELVNKLGKTVSSIVPQINRASKLVANTSNLNETIRKAISDSKKDFLPGYDLPFGIKKVLLNNTLKDIWQDRLKNTLTDFGLSFGQNW